MLTKRPLVRPLHALWLHNVWMRYYVCRWTKPSSTQHIPALRLTYMICKIYRASSREAGCGTTLHNSTTTVHVQHEWLVELPRDLCGTANRRILIAHMLVPSIMLVGTHLKILQDAKKDLLQCALHCILISAIVGIIPVVRKKKL